MFSLLGSSFLITSCNQTSGMLGGGALGTAVGAAMGYAIDGGAGGAILGGVVGGLAGSAVGSHAGAQEERVQASGTQFVPQHHQVVYVPEPTPGAACVVKEIAVPVAVVEPVPVSARSAVVYRDVGYEERLANDRKIALEQARIDRQRFLLEEQKNRALREENERYQKQLSEERKTLAEAQKIREERLLLEERGKGTQRYYDERERQRKATQEEWDRRFGP